MRALNPDYIHRVWVDVMTARLSAEVEAAGPGHCLRVSDVPRSILADVAERLNAARLEGA